MLLSFVLRALISPHRDEFDYEEDYENAQFRTREPLLNPQSGQASAGHSDLWSSLVREKVFILKKLKEFYFDEVNR